MPDGSVKFFESTMSGAPSLSGSAGALIAVLDACLIDGFGSVTVDSLAVASNVATATVSAGHQFAMTGTTGPVIRMSGATPSGLNGDWRVTVTSATTFTFAISGMADQTATGTISAKRAPAGFSKAFSATNKAAYRSDDLTGTRLYCRVDDTGTTTATMLMYEAMTSIDAGVGKTPASDLSFTKSSAASGLARPWALVSDGRLLYFFSAYGGGEYSVGLVFGDILDYSAPNAFGSWLLVSTTNAATTLARLSTNANNAFLARTWAQTGGFISAALYSHNITGAVPYMGSYGSPYPNPVDNSVHFWPVEIWEGITCARGLAPGLWNPIHAGIPGGTTIDDIPQLSGRTLKIFRQTSSYSCALDLTGPWR